MISVAIIGQGNVAFHLQKVMENTKEILVQHIHSRSEEINTSNIDVVIIAVSDNAIAEVSSKIKTEDVLVVHTSGATKMNVLKNAGRKGVFYMLQSFSKEILLNFEDIPFCLEAENQKDLELLETLALSIGKKVYRISSIQRQYLHTSAVFVNNFVNHLYTIGNDICKTNNVPFEVLYPIIKETAEKITRLSPKEAQTGPAKRNDTKTINKHLSLLDNSQQKIYKILTESIQNEY